MAMPGQQMVALKDVVRDVVQKAYQELLRLTDVYVAPV